MIRPYTAVGLIPTVRGIRRREDIKTNLEHLAHLFKAASWLSSLDLPVRLIAIPEGALQAFNDEVLDLDHIEFARTCAIDIPGPETEALGKLAREYDAFVMAQAKARHPDLKDRFFVIDYKGRIVGRQEYGAGSTYVSGVIDIEALRDHRARAQWDNWLKDLRTELYQLLYEQPIYPKNLYLKRAPMKHAEYRKKVIEPQIKLLQDRGVWARPSRA